VTAHTDGGVPVIVMDCGELTEQKVGELFGFLEISSGISAGLMGVDPFGQPGVETYQQNLFRMLGKPDSN
jgi:glucose-6-phosphate isomerase